MKRILCPKCQSYIDLEEFYSKHYGVTAECETLSSQANMSERRPPHTNSP